MSVEPDSVLVGSEQLAARFADHVAITATQALVSPNWFKCRGSSLDYSASVFSNVGSKLPHGMLEAVPGQIRDTIQRQVFVLGRPPDSSPNSSSGNVECIFSSPIPTLQPGLFFTDPWHKGRGCCTQLLLISESKLQLYSHAPSCSCCIKAPALIAGGGNITSSTGSFLGPLDRCNRTSAI